MTTLQGMNLLAGWGLAYPGAGLAPAMLTAPVTGRSRDGSWLQVVYPSGSDNAAWIYSRLVRISGSLEEIPIVAVPPPATGGRYGGFGRVRRPVYPHALVLHA